jgi:hypothetical protein
MQSWGVWPRVGVVPLTPLVLIWQDVFREPCITAEGHTYEKKNIKEWLQNNQTSPSTRQPLDKNILYEDKYLKLIIQNILKKDMGLQ